LTQGKFNLKKKFIFSCAKLLEMSDNVELCFYLIDFPKLCKMHVGYIYIYISKVRPLKKMGFDTNCSCALFVVFMRIMGKKPLRVYFTIFEKKNFFFYIDHSLKHTNLVLNSNRKLAMLIKMSTFRFSRSPPNQKVSGKIFFGFVGFFGKLKKILLKNFFYIVYFKILNSIYNRI
jgi:hypothetical protein